MFVKQRLSPKCTPTVGTEGTRKGTKRVTSLSVSVYVALKVPTWHLISGLIYNLYGYCDEFSDDFCQLCVSFVFF